MKLSEKFQDVISFTRCEEEICIYEDIISTLENSRSKNIGVMGETNCGKTSLINQLSGTEVRKPTKVSLDETPLMVTFCSDEVREGYEKVDVRNERCEEAGIAFFEIPINMAIDYETGKPTRLLEEMDAVIYIISAIMPLTGSDVENLRSVTNRFPMIIWISKTDMLDGEQEYQECSEYIRREFSNMFQGTVCEFYDGRNKDFPEEMLRRFGELSLEDIREFHIQQVEQIAKNVLIEKLEFMLEELRDRRKVRELEKSEADQAYRQQMLRWNDIRLAMMEKEQEVIDYADKKTSAAKISVKKKAVSLLETARNKKDWICGEWKQMLEEEINTISRAIMDDVKDLSDADAAWLVSEVNRRFDQRLVIEDMKNQVSYVEGSVGTCGSAPGYKKVMIAAGSGFVAGGVILSGLSLVPTCIVAIPASLLTLTLIKDSMNDYGKYNEGLIRFVEECCDRNFTKLTKQIHTCIHEYYDKVVSEIMNISEAGEPEIDFRDIVKAEDEIKEKMYQLRAN